VGPATFPLAESDLATPRAEASRSAPASPVTTCAGDVAPLFEWIERAGHERVWLAGGGDLAGEALAVGRVDEVIVTIAPGVLGAGPALFDAAELPPPRFTLAEARAFGGTAARLRWERVTELT
jgi:riboflavin biosynthesis pyrimidine reductase